MITGFLTNAVGTLIPALLAVAITYILLMTVTERSLRNRHIIAAFLVTWAMATATGYFVETRNFIHVAIAFAVIGTFLLLRGVKTKGKPDEGK